MIKRLQEAQRYQNNINNVELWNRERRQEPSSTTKHDNLIRILRACIVFALMRARNLNNVIMLGRDYN